MHAGSEVHLLVEHVGAGARLVLVIVVVIVNERIDILVIIFIIVIRDQSLLLSTLLLRILLTNRVYVAAATLPHWIFTRRVRCLSDSILLSLLVVYVATAVVAIGQVFGRRGLVVARLVGRLI